VRYNSIAPAVSVNAIPHLPPQKRDKQKQTIKAKSTKKNENKNERKKKKEN